MKLWDKQDVNYPVLERLYHQTSWVDSQVYLTTRLIYFRIALIIISCLLELYLFIYLENSVQTMI